MKNILHIILLLVGTFVAGFFVGKLSKTKQVEQTTIHWEDGDHIAGKITPDEVETTIKDPTGDIELPSDIFQSSHLPSPKGDTVYYGIPVETIITRQSPDSDSLHIYRAVYADYIRIRNDHVSVFDNDTLGTLTIDATIQFNRSQGYGYDFKSKIKNVENVIPPKPITFIPYASSSYSTSDYLGLGGGFFYHNLGLEYQYQIDLKQNNISFEPRGNKHQFGLKYKFR